MAEILERAKKKIKEAFTADEQIHEIEPFYLDEAAEQANRKQVDMQLQAIQIAKLLYESRTGEKIESISQMETIHSEGPVKYYRETKIQKNLEEKKPMTLQLLEEGFDTLSIADKIKLPDGFDDVVEAFRKIKWRDNINWTNFVIVNEEVKISDYFISKLTNKSRFFAITPMQKKRLAYAQRLLEEYKEMESLLREEANEAGMPEVKVKRGIDDGLFYGSVPFPLRIVLKPGEGFSYTRELAINHLWVVGGFTQFADQINMIRLRPTVEVKKWEDPRVWLKFWKTDMDGARRSYIIQKDRKNHAYQGMWREADIFFEKHEYKLVDGKLTIIEK